MPEREKCSQETMAAMTRFFCRATHTVVLTFLFNSPLLFSQDYSSFTPLDGFNSLSLTASFLPTVSSIDEEVIPVPNPTFAFSSPSGVGHEVGISWSRLMPKLFVSTSTTFDLRLSWIKLEQVLSASGLIEIKGNGGEPVLEPVQQQTTGVANIIALGARFAFDTQPMAQISPTITVGGSLGQIIGIDYETTFDPEGAAPVSEFGLPTTGPTPDRRFFYGALHLGVGGRFNLGNPEHSIALIPESELVIPLTSLLKDGFWIPLGVRLGLGIRLPL